MYGYRILYKLISARVRVRARNTGASKNHLAVPATAAERSCMITRQQMDYMRMYQTGATMKEIAQEYHVNVSTVSRVISRALKVKCPFSPKCEKCPLDECAIDDKYAMFLNSTEDFKKSKN